MQFHERINKIKYGLIPVLGLLFLLWYIRSAGADVVYSDYIRIIDEYLPDVSDLSRLRVPDILTRIPASFAARAFNVRTFGFSVTFDRMLTLAGMGLIALVLYFYMYRHRIGIFWQLMTGIILFSLNKWEILLNGTAWAHVVSFGLFFLNYQLIDLLWTGEADAKQELMLMLMPFLWLLFAGEYIASYACTMILICLLGILTGGANSWAGKGEKGMFVGILSMTLAALLLYMLSRHYAVWEHAGAADTGIKELVLSQPWFLPRFFIKTFAGTAAGQETLQAFFAGGRALPDTAVMAAGMIVLAAYVFAFILYFAGDMLEKTVFPLILLISGLMNHILVTAGRWIFLREDYALSSRYAGQFMIGIIGILIVFALYGRDDKRVKRRAAQRRKKRIVAAAAAVSVFIAAGNCYTTYQEIRKAPYREANYENMAAALLNHEDHTEEDLCRIMEWHKDPAVLYRAIGILEENRFNVFRVPVFEEGAEDAG
jgi:hypothetical protein